MRSLRRFVASVAAVATLGCLAMANSAYALDVPQQETQSTGARAASHNTAGTAQSINVNQDVSDAIHDLYKGNWYKLTVPSNGYVQLNMRNSATSEEPQWNLKLYRANDTENSIFSWAHNGNKNNESSQKYGLTGGTYYLCVSPYWGVINVNYTLKVLYEQHNDWETEPNDAAGAADSVQPNGTIHGSFDSYYSHDWYKFTLPQDGVVQLKFANALSDKDYTNLYAKLYKADDMSNALFDSTYNNDFAMTSANHSSPKIGLSAGTYYVDVYAGDEYSEYSMTVDFTGSDAWEKEPNDSSNQSSAITVGKTYTGNITNNSDNDWYRFTLDRKQQVQIHFTSKKQSQSYGFWRVYLYSSNNINNALTKVEIPCSQASANSKAMTLDKGSYYVKMDSSWLFDGIGTGSEYSLLVTRPSNKVTMYRLYNPHTGEHFYTANAAEKNGLAKIGWHYEGIGWVAPTSGAPVYRLYNSHVKGGDHHYTMNKAERDNLVKAGWRYEGVGWYSGGKVPLYRQYNRHAKTGTHNYTTSKAENDHLVKVGWRAEGIGWYALSAQ